MYLHTISSVQLEKGVTGNSRENAERYISDKKQLIML